MKAIKISSKVRVGFGMGFLRDPEYLFLGIPDCLPPGYPGNRNFSRGMGYPDKKPPLVKDSQSIVLESMIIPTITFYNEKKQYIG